MNKLKVKFTQKPHRGLGFLHGWIRIIIKCNNTIDETWASDVFPPFYDMLDFLEEVYLGKLPSEFGIDVEGEIVKFNADKTDADDLIEFKIYRETNGEYGFKTPKTNIRAKLNRIEFVFEFVEKFRLFLDHDYKPEYWGGSMGTMPYKKLEKLEGIISKT